MDLTGGLAERWNLKELARSGGDPQDGPGGPEPRTCRQLLGLQKRCPISCSVFSPRAGEVVARGLRRPALGPGPHIWGGQELGGGSPLGGAARGHVVAPSQALLAACRVSSLKQPLPELPTDRHLVGPVKCRPRFPREATLPMSPL